MMQAYHCFTIHSTVYTINNNHALLTAVGTVLLIHKLLHIFAPANVRQTSLTTW